MDILEWLKDVGLKLSAVWAPILLAYAFVLLRERIQQVKDERLRLFLTQLVEAAEQIYGAKEGAKKLGYVQGIAEAKGLHLSRAAIESAVFKLNGG